MVRIYRIASCLLLAALLLTPLPAGAEVKEIFAEGTYIMGDGETPSVAQERAIQEAKRYAVEQAGTYLETFTEVQNMQLTRDEIRVFASGIVQTTVIEQKRALGNNDSLRFYVKVRCLVDSDSIQTMRSKLQDKSSLETLKKVQADYDRSQQEIADLKAQLAQAKTEQNRRAIESRISQNEQSFTANQWFEKGYAYQSAGDFDQALSAYDTTIRLNASLPEPYNNRGVIYEIRGEYDRALAEYNTAVRLNPSFDFAYNNRGNVYLKKGRADDAIADYNRALRLNARYSEAYNNRGLAYQMKDNHQAAISDFTKALQLNPNFLQAYKGRGDSYQLTQQYSQAVQDYNRALQINPEYGEAYVSRGNVFGLTGQYSRAVADSIQAVRLLPQAGVAYMNLAQGYELTGRRQAALENYEMALALLSPDRQQEYDKCRRRTQGDWYSYREWL